MAAEEGFEPPGPSRAQRLSRWVIALWLASKLLTTKGGIRLALDGLGTDFSVLGQSGIKPCRWPKSYRTIESGKLILPFH